MLFYEGFCDNIYSVTSYKMIDIAYFASIYDSSR